MIIQEGSKLVMIGDSITDCSRARPIGEGRGDSFGTGYVSQVNGFFGAFYPERNIRIINMGISGNTVRDLENRWEADVIGLKPDWLSIMIGINDVWRQFDLPLHVERHVYIDEYKDTLEKLIQRTLPHLKGLVLMTPYFIEANKNDDMRKAMDGYGNVVKELAKKYGTIVVDTQASFDKVLKYRHPMSITWDRVHPNPGGHMVITRAFLDAIGFNWSHEMK